MKQLTLEQQQRFSSAIKHGFITKDVPTDTHTFVWTWIRKHPNRVTTLVRLRNILGHAPQWEDLTDDVISDLKDDMEFELAPNSVRTICAELKAVLNRNKATKPISSKTFGNLLKAKKVPVQNIYLTRHELQKIHAYKPKSERERYVKNIFLIEAITGARNVDCRRMSLANIQKYGEEEVLVYVPQKHPVEVTVPVHKWLKELLVQDYPEQAKSIRISYFCKVLKWICFQCGIRNKVVVFRGGRSVTDEKWKLIGSHCGRRTFATLLSTSHVAIEDISDMMGHSNANKPNIEMTSGYICERRKLGKSVFALFK